jgi:N6-adenosine-specific RNA methylase IME4
MSYRIILADPPWQYRVWSRDMGRRTAESFYRTMALEDIKALRPRIDQWAAKDCALFLWVTSPCLPNGPAVIDAWGFRYINVAFTWVKRYRNGKPFMGNGHYTRQNAEPCLLGIRGRMPVKVRNILSVIETEHSTRSQHSRKPDEQYARIEALYDGPYLELFARQQWPGWDTWGLEAPGDMYQRVTDKPALDNRTSRNTACVQCGADLGTARSDTHYCSPACRQRAYRGRRAAP